eukprot:SAG11_NODE_1346_length_5144_cov_2.242220_2_plen_1048_part_00
MEAVDKENQMPLPKKSGGDDTVMLSSALRKRLQNLQRSKAPEQALSSSCEDVTVNLQQPESAGMSPSQVNHLMHKLGDASIDLWSGILSDRLGLGPADWLSFLEQVETRVEQEPQAGMLDADSVLHLHRLAAETLPKSIYRKYLPYEKLWLRHATWKLKYRDASDAKQMLKHMQVEGMGERNGVWYTLMAQIEGKTGKLTKVESVLRKGLEKCPASEHAAIEIAWDQMLTVAFPRNAEPFEVSDSTETIMLLKSGDQSTSSDCTQTVQLSTTSRAPTMQSQQPERTVSLSHRKTVPERDPPSKKPGASGQSTGSITIQNDMDAPTVMLSTSSPTSSSRVKPPSNTANGLERAKPAKKPVRKVRSLGGLKSFGGAVRAPRSAPEALVTASQEEVIASQPGSVSKSAGLTFDRLSLGPIQERDGRSSDGSCNSTASEETILASACPVDLTGNGKVDAVGYDTSGNGKIDSLDTTKDGLIDSKIVPNEIQQGQIELSEQPTVEISEISTRTSQEQNIQLAHKEEENRRALLKVVECPSSENKECITIENRSYRKLCIVGRGGSCKVYKVIGPNGTILAMKRIRVDNDDGFEQFINEIELLFKLKGKDNIIQLHDQSVNRSKGMVYMVFEYGEIDLHKLLQRQQGKPVKDNFIRLYWQQMLEAVHTIHEQRIVHSDLKPANFLIVEGTLKLIDFGIAAAIEGNDTTNIVRDAQVGTINYMSPEALSPPETENEFKLSRKSDIWSMGCILYQMVFGKTPFHHLTNIMSKMRAITDERHDIKFPDCPDMNLIDTLKSCLQRDLVDRPGIPELLQHPYVTGMRTEPVGSVADVDASSNATLQAILQQVATAGKSGQDASAMVQMMLTKLQRGEDVTGTFATDGDSANSASTANISNSTNGSHNSSTGTITSTATSTKSTSSGSSSDTSSTQLQTLRAPPLAPPPPPPLLAASAVNGTAGSTNACTTAAQTNVEIFRSGDTPAELHEQIRSRAAKLRPVSSRPSRPEHRAGGGGGTGHDLMMQRMAALRRAHSTEDTATVDLAGNNSDNDDTSGW